MSEFRETLETFPNPHPGRDYTLETVCPEFTSVCPKTGQPDYGTITIVYRPAEVCFELKSLKMYLQRYRNHGAYYEDVSNLIFEDLVDVTKPRWLKLVSDWSPRGGIRSVCTIETEA
ncbi:MAG: preQ(1) synthase [Planctomycetota bacterium]